MLTYVITATFDYGDSEKEQTKIVRSEKPISSEDSDFLSYLFSCDLQSSDNVYVDVKLLEDCIEQTTPQSTIPFLFLERQEGVLHAHVEQVIIEELSLSRLNQLLRTRQTLTGLPTMPQLSNSFHSDNADFVFVVDLNKVKPGNRVLTDLSEQSRTLLQANKLERYIATLRHYHADQKNQNVQTTVLYFPDNACVGLLEISRDRDGVEQETLSLYSMDGKLFAG